MDEKYEALLLVCLAVEPAMHTLLCEAQRVVCTRESPCHAIVCTCRSQTAARSQWQHILSFLWATFETGTRGFLLGFGLMICQDVLRSPAQGDAPVPSSSPQEGDKTDTQTPLPPNISHIFTRAKVAGLGVGCLVVGASLLLPASLRQKMLTV